MNSTDSVMSAEPGRKTAYSNDLRWRIVYQRIAMNLPLVKIAQNLNVAVSTVHRIYLLFEESGTVDPLSPRKGWIAGDLIYAVNCMLLELFWRTHQCT